MPRKNDYRPTSEHKAKIGEANRRQFEDPAKRQAVSDRFRALWQDPEWVASRKKRSVQTPEEVHASRRAYYERNKETIKAKVRAYRGMNLEETRQRSREYQRKHPEAAKARLHKWMSNPENRAKTYAKARAYWKAHPDLRHLHFAKRRALMVNAYVENVDRRVVLERAGGLCGWCSEPVDPATFHVDHIVALVHGGEHSYANTQPVHPTCNYEKRTVLKERAA